MFGAAILIALLVLLVPGQAYAWGPVTHVSLIEEALRSGIEALAMAADIGSRNYWALLYGTLAPDFFIAKNMQVFKHHTHNWDRAFAMLRHAEDEAEVAFSIGYLSHLAADVVSHNVYVPYKWMEVPLQRGRKHTYWEIRFEHNHSEETWETVSRLRDKDFWVLDRYLSRFQLPTFLTFKANLSMTRSVTRVATGPGARKLWDRMERRSRFHLDPMERKLFTDLSTRAIKDILENGESAAICREDPRGHDRIDYARQLTTNLRRMYRRGPGAGSHYRQLAENTALQFRNSLIQDHLDRTSDGDS